MENTKDQTTVEARRSFLKKAAYVAPAMMALGTLATPASASTASSSLGGNIIPVGQSAIPATTTTTQQLADQLFGF